MNNDKLDCFRNKQIDMGIDGIIEKIQPYLGMYIIFHSEILVSFNALAMIKTGTWTLYIAKFPKFKIFVIKEQSQKICSRNFRHKVGVINNNT